MTNPSMRLLVAIINDRGKLDEALSGFIELGITGATVLNSEGMGRLLSDEIPIFAGLQALVAGSRPQNVMILSVIPENKVTDVVALLQDVCGNFADAATGIAFTLPIDQVIGLAPELGTGGGPI